jgi:hypothetical protein
MPYTCTPGGYDPIICSERTTKGGQPIKGHFQIGSAAKEDIVIEYVVVNRRWTKRSKPKGKGIVRAKRKAIIRKGQYVAGFTVPTTPVSSTVPLKIIATRTDTGKTSQKGDLELVP